MSDQTPDEMRDQLLRMARAVLDMRQGEIDDPDHEAEAGNDLAAAVIAYCTPRMIVTQPPLADHVHQWKKVGEDLQGMTLTRTYECPSCLSHTTLVGPYGVSSPFDVEEVTHDRAQTD